MLAAAAAVTQPRVSRVFKIFSVREFLLHPFSHLFNYVYGHNRAGENL
jgi:hypothetical protein